MLGVLGPKGQLGDLAAIATAFVIVAITLSLCAVILGEFRNADSVAGNENATEVIDKGMEGMSQLSTFLPIIGLVAAAGIVLMIVRRLV